MAREQFSGKNQVSAEIRKKDVIKRLKYRGDYIPGVLETIVEWMGRRGAIGVWNRKKRENLSYFLYLYIYETLFPPKKK